MDRDFVAAANTGTVTVTNNTGNISATNGRPSNIVKAAAPASPIALNFGTVSSTNSAATGITIDRVSGNLTVTTTTTTKPSDARHPRAEHQRRRDDELREHDLDTSAGAGSQS
jgi:hypothetical protein